MNSAAPNPRFAPVTNTHPPLDVTRPIVPARTTGPQIDY
jgi:hypothetical protein